MPETTTNHPNLWADAFTEFERTQPELCEKFTALISLKTDGNNDPGLSSSSPVPPSKTAKSSKFEGDQKMAKAALKQIQDLDDKRHAGDKLSSKTKILFEDIIKVVVSIKDLVAPAIAFNPYAATAWSAICFILPLCLTSTKENEAAITGLNRVANLMTVYKWKEKAYLHGDAAVDFAEAAKKVYTAIFEFEAFLMIHQNKHVFRRLTHGIARSGKWEDLVSEIQQLDTDCSATTQAVDRFQAQKWVEEQRRWHRNEIQEAKTEKMRQNLRTMYKYSKYDMSKNIHPRPSQGTGNWFLRNVEFLLWRDSPAPAILWLNAGPLYGKSTLARHLVENVNTMTMQQNTPLLCYFFFGKGDSERNNACRAICAILHQLIRQRPALYEYTEMNFEERGDVFLEDLETLWLTFVDTISALENEQIICILDGLDECEDPSHTYLLSRLVEHFEDVQHKGTSSELKVLITSRPNVTISGVFEELFPLSHCFTVSGDQSYDDLSLEMEIVIEQNLERLARNLRLIRSEKEELKSRLSSSPNRSYLWVRLIIDLLSKRSGYTGDIIRNIFTEIPRELDAAYDALFGSISPYDVEYVKQLFHLVLAANRALTVQELVFAQANACRHEDFCHCDSLLKVNLFWHLPNICGQCLVIVDSKVYFLHETAAAFLKEQPEHSRLPESLSYKPSKWHGAFPDSRNQHLIARACIMQLLQPEFLNNPFQRKLGQAYFYHEGWNTFADYAVTEWARHVRLVGPDLDEDLCLSIIKNLYSDSKCFRLWSTMLKSSNDVRKLTSPMSSSCHIWSAYFRQMVVLDRVCREQQHINVNMEDDCGRTALLYAAHQGHIHVVETLLDRDAAIESKDLIGSTSLSLAAEAGHLEIVELLLRKGADPESCDALDQKPIDYATHHKHTTCVQRLKQQKPAGGASASDHRQLDPATSNGLEAVLRTVREYTDQAIQSGSWTSENDHVLCQSKSSRSRTGGSVMYDALVSAILAFLKGNIVTARAQVVYALSRTKKIAATDNPSALIHFLRLLGIIGHYRLTNLARAYCFWIACVCGKLAQPPGGIGTGFAQLHQLLTTSAEDISLVVDKVFRTISDTLAVNLGPYHMQTVYTRHVWIDIKAFSQAPETVSSELYNLAEEVRTHYRSQTTPQYVQVLIDIAQNHFSQSRYGEAKKAEEQIVKSISILVSEAQIVTGKNLRMLCEGHRIAAESLTAQGHFEEAETHLKQAIVVATGRSELSPFSTSDKYRTIYTDWLRARGDYEKAAEAVSLDDKTPYEAKQRQSTFDYFARQSIEVGDIAEAQAKLKSEYPGVWPNRLLHVKSMTSYPREEGDIYNGVSRPEYYSLSYKWGVYIVDNGARLDIEGIDWMILAVDPKRWTVPELEKGLKMLAKEVAFVWLDVACVNQSLDGVSMLEVKREPQIFLQAKEAYIWFVDFTDEDFEKHLNIIADASSDLRDASSQRMDNMAAYRALKNAFPSLKALLSSPWFQSHYALREILMKRDAIILNRGGNHIPIQCNGDAPATLENLTYICMVLLMQLKDHYRLGLLDFDASEPDQSTDIQSEVNDFFGQCLELVESSGPFMLFSNAPYEVWKVTDQLLDAGRAVLTGTANQSGYGYVKMVCECRPGVKCLPCIMQVSYKVGDVVVHSMYQY